MKPNAKNKDSKVHDVMPGPTARFTLRCNRSYNLAVEGWAAGWKPTSTSVNCEHCLRMRKNERR